MRTFVAQSRLKKVALQVIARQACCGRVVIELERSEKDPKACQIWGTSLPSVISDAREIVFDVQISDDTIEKLRQIFLSLDDDNSGTLSARELSSSGKMNIFESLVCTTTRFAHDLVIDRNGIGKNIPRPVEHGVHPMAVNTRWRRLMRHWSV